MPCPERRRCIALWRTPTLARPSRMHAGVRLSLISAGLCAHACLPVQLHLPSLPFFARAATSCPPLAGYSVAIDRDDSSDLNNRYPYYAASVAEAISTCNGAIWCRGFSSGYAEGYIKLKASAASSGVAQGICLYSKIGGCCPPPAAGSDMHTACNS